MDDFEFVDTGKRSAEISESATLVLHGLYTILYKMSKNVLTDKNITILFTVVHCVQMSRELHEGEDTDQSIQDFFRSNRSGRR